MPHECRVTVAAEPLSYGKLLRVGFHKNDGHARHTELTLTLSAGDDPRAVLAWLAEHAAELARQLDEAPAGDRYGNLYDAAGNLLKRYALPGTQGELFGDVGVEPPAAAPAGVPLGWVA
ncbi:MAG: hypothetical protein AMXMBFR7_25630 [Planctomycetota bacterium]